MKKLRILALVHDHLVPPEDTTGIDILEAEWKMEYDVIETLRERGHEVRVLGVHDDLAGIRPTAGFFEPHIIFNLMEAFAGVTTFDQNVVSYLELLRLRYTGCNPRGLILARDKALSKKLLAYHRIRVPEFTVARPGRKPTLPKRLGFPLIVKSVFFEASAVLLVFILFGALRNFALVPTNFVTIYGLHFGFALDVLLLSFALGDRISILRRERAQAHAETLKAQALLLEATRENERELERRIAQRTAELNSVNERLRAEASDRESLMQLLRHQEEHLRFMAQHDPLTGLPNRTSMHQRLALALELAKRNRKKVAVMMVDLDGFKRINDTRGHPAGDQALVQLASRLRTSVRGSDTVARYGGDEFVILAGELDRLEDAGMVAEKVADMISVPVSIPGGPAHVSCSIGISVFPDDAESGEDLIALADQAMYATKTGKGKRYAFYGAG